VEVPLAKVPEADLVEVVQADGLGDAVDQGGVGDGRGDDVGQVELEEVDCREDGGGAGVAD
jgi:hypothetical protein